MSKKKKNNEYIVTYKPNKIKIDMNEMRLNNDNETTKLGQYQRYISRATGYWDK